MSSHGNRKEKELGKTTGHTFTPCVFKQPRVVNRSEQQFIIREGATVLQEEAPTSLMTNGGRVRVNAEVVHRKEERDKFELSSPTVLHDVGDVQRALVRHLEGNLDRDPGVHVLGISGLALHSPDQSSKSQDA